MNASIEDFIHTNYAYLVKDGYKFEGIFSYTDPNGSPLYWKARYKNYSAKKKHFAYVHQQKDSFVKLKPKFESGDPLYNLTGIKKAELVWIVEGELKADTLMRSDDAITATTTGGLTTVKGADWTPLKGKKVIIWPDTGKDFDGYIQAIAAILLPLGCSIQAVDQAALGLEEKQDCVDWIKKNISLSAWSIPLNDIKPQLQKEPLSKINSAELLKTKFAVRERYLPWLLKQSVNMIHAWRGTGKTHVAFGIAYALATKNKFLTWQATKKVKVLYIDGELAVTEVQERLQEIVLSAPGREIPDSLDWITPDLQLEGMPDLSTVKGQTKIDALIGETEVIIIDNLSCLVRGDGNENDADSWSSVQEWALKHKREGRSIVFIHHSGKGGSQRGTSKKEDIMDVVMSLKQPKDYKSTDGAYFEVHYEKKRNIRGKDAEPFTAKLISEFGPQTWEVRSLQESTRDQVCKMDDEGFTPKEICAALGISKALVSRYLKEKKEMREQEPSETTL